MKAKNFNVEKLYCMQCEEIVDVFELKVIDDKVEGMIWWGCPSCGRLMMKTLSEEWIW